MKRKYVNIVDEEHLKCCDTDNYYTLIECFDSFKMRGNRHIYPYFVVIKNILMILSDKLNTECPNC